MAIPDYQTLMLPLLQIAADGREHSLSEARDVLADQFELTPDERTQLLPSGRQTLFGNRVAWLLMRRNALTRTILWKGETRLSTEP
jgi:restriction system protein